MKRLSILIAAAAAAILSATAAQAAPKKFIENDIRIYSIDTYKSDDEVAGILAKAFDGNVLAGIEHGGAIFVAKADGANKSLINTLKKIGATDVQHTAMLSTRSGKAVPVSVGQTLELADGAINGKAKTRDLETGLFTKTTPTTLKNGDIKVAYEQKIVELVDLKHANIAGDKIDLATVHQQAVSGSARLKKGSSMILAGFSKDAAKGFFGKKNRVIVTVVTPRQL
jgi:Flp pilus assembly secretin CpaC